MKIVVFSEHDERFFNKSWERAGEDLKYFQNGLQKPNGKPYYTGTFSYKFTHTKDTVYFAYSVPYTYSDLMRYLLSLENDPSRNNNFSRRSLCKTIGGNRCDYLTITDSEIPEYMKHRKGVVFSSRVHPGETVGSWIMQGIIDFLTGPSKEASIIRENFIVKAIPMLNPDGVINGNYRTNLAGTDLNRKWKSPNKILQPTIYASKKMIKNFAGERDIELICDLHGHSRSMGIFMYGCNIPENPMATRVLPLTISKLSSQFKYDFCTFRIQKSKESTMRISLFKELKVTNVFTMETSFCGSDGLHYHIEDFYNIAKNLCVSLLVYCDLTALGASLEFDKKNILKEFETHKELLEDNPENLSESDSDPSEDNLDEEILLELMPPIPKKKVRKGSKLKSKNVKISKSDKKSYSEVRRRENFSSRKNPKDFSIEKKIETIKKCEECGELDVSGHVCGKKKAVKSSLSPTPSINQRKIIKSPTVNSNLSLYINNKGRPVRDQATQTMYIKRLQNSDSTSIYNSSLNLPSPVKSRLEALPKLIVENTRNKLEIVIPSLGHISSVLDINRKKLKKNY